MNTDPIADFLTRIRNASSAGSKVVEIPGSNVKRAMTEILFDQGYILNFKFEDDDKQEFKPFSGTGRRLNSGESVADSSHIPKSSFKAFSGNGYRLGK